MAETNDGGLYFVSGMDNSRLDAAIIETIRRIQGMSDAVVHSGGELDKMANQASEAMSHIEQVCSVQSKNLQELEAEYTEVNKRIGEAFKKGNDDEYRALIERRKILYGEIEVKKKVLAETKAQQVEAEKAAAKVKKWREEAEKNKQAHDSLRTQIRKLKEEMARLRTEGIDEDTEAYKRLVNELGRLQDIQGDINTQGKIMSNDENRFAGVLSGLNGVVGGFTAAQGAMSLFAGESENLQRIMLKVQSLMSITMGLQQVQQMMNKDSAFQLVTMTAARKKWHELLEIGRRAKVADTAATAANTAATTAATTATIGWSGALRMAWAALKAFPVAWIVAGVGTIVSIMSSMISKTNEAKKAQEDFANSIAENCYKPIGAIEELSQKWAQLGDDFDAKSQFIKDNQKDFDDLGVSVKGVTDAENLLIRNKERFVDAQIAKAKAMVYTEQAMSKVKELVKAETEYNSMSDTVIKNVQAASSNFGATGYGVVVTNQAKVDKKEEIEALRAEINKGYQDAMDEEKTAAKLLADAGIEAANKVAQGTIAALEQAIAEKNRLLKDLTIGTDDFNKTKEEIERLQAEMDKAMGRNTQTRTGGTTTSKTKDVFAENLEKMKAEYTRFMKWVNSGDSILVKSAYQEFDGLLKQGATYIEYLKNQRDQILQVDVANRTAEQNTQLRQLNDSIAEETKKTVLESFNNELSEQLTNAQSIVEMLKVIEQKRAELKNDDTELGNAKSDVLDKAETDVKAKQREELQDMLDEYATFEEKKQKIVEGYAQKRELAELSGNQTIIAQLNKAEQRDLLQLSLDQLKLSPDYIRAFEDLDFASTETLKALVARFEEVKNAVGENLNPEDVRQYIQTIQAMVDELNSRDPFGALKRGYNELKAAGVELKNAQSELNAIRENGGAGTDAEVKAIARVNRAKDDFIRKNGEVRRTEKEVERQVGDLLNALSNVGNAIDGEAGKVISLIGDIGTFVLSTIDSVKAVATTGTEALSMIEKASAILGVISAAYQVANKIISIFKGDDGTAAYEAAQKVYKSYIETLHEVVDAELELLATMSGKDAQDKFNYATSLIQRQADAARELGKQYLNAGASKGFLGIGSSASHGTEQRKDITNEAWRQAKAVADAYNIDWAKLSNGRMTGLFDLTAEQLKVLKAEAPLFFAQLHEDTREYINDIIASADAFEDAKNKYNESLTGIAFDSMRSDFLSSLQDMELDAKKISDNIQDYMRKALINDMFKKAYQGELQKYYDAFAAAMKEDSDGGALITESERRALDAMRDAIVSGATYATAQINEQFKDLLGKNAADDTMSGAVAGVTEETAGMVAGQMNAIRINQLETAVVLRNQLMQLNIIAQNTAYNRHLAKIDRIISLLESGASLRSQGLS